MHRLYEICQPLTDLSLDEPQAPQRLEQVLDYLRNAYYYCFWCGTQYASAEELEKDCPGLTEEDHD
jgi:rubrerythrin